MLWFFSPSQPLKPSWDQQVQNWSSYLKSTGFYQTEVKHRFLSNRSGILRKHQQYRANDTWPNLPTVPGDCGGTVSTDRSVPCRVHVLYRPQAYFSGVSYVLLSRDVNFACCPLLLPLLYLHCCQIFTFRTTYHELSSRTPWQWEISSDP